MREYFWEQAFGSSISGERALTTSKHEANGGGSVALCRSFALAHAVTPELAG